jgi:hypothetical protein
MGRAPTGRFEYRVRYRREYGKEKAKTFGRLSAARHYVQRIKAHDSGDSMFQTERLLYAAIDRRSVSEWDRTWEDDRR